MERLLAEKKKIPLKKFDMNRYRTSLFFIHNLILVTPLLYIFSNPKQQEFSVNS